MGLWLAQAAKLWHVPVGDAMLWKRTLEDVEGEVGHSARGWNGPHVHQRLNTMVAEQRDELAEGSGGMPDGQDYGVRCEGSTAGTRMCLTYVWPLICSLPENRKAGS